MRDLLWKNQKGQLSAPSNMLNLLVSAAGFEPATHALKEYSTLDSSMRKYGQESRSPPMLMRVFMDSRAPCTLQNIPANFW